MTHDITLSYLPLFIFEFSVRFCPFWSVLHTSRDSVSLVSGICSILVPIEALNYFWNPANISVLQVPAIWKKMYTYDQHLYGGGSGTGARLAPSLALHLALVVIVLLVAGCRTRGQQGWTGSSPGPWGSGEGREGVTSVQRTGSSWYRKLPGVGCSLQYRTGLCIAVIYCTVPHCSHVCIRQMRKTTLDFELSSFHNWPFLPPDLY